MGTFFCNSLVYTGGYISELNADRSTPASVSDKNCQVPVSFADGATETASTDSIHSVIDGFCGSVLLQSYLGARWQVLVLLFYHQPDNCWVIAIFSGHVPCFGGFASLFHSNSLVAHWCISLFAASTYVICICLSHSNPGHRLALWCPNVCAFGARYFETGNEAALGDCDQDCCNNRIDTSIGNGSS